MSTKKTKKVEAKPDSTNISFKPLKAIADLVKNAWGYFMTFLAVVTFIWTLGVKSERKTLDNAAIQRDVSELKQSVKKLDTITVSIEEIKKTQNELVESQNAMRNSYVKYLVNSPTLSKKDFIEYMQGLEFQIAPMQTIAPLSVDADTQQTNMPESKIIVKPVKK